MQEMGTMKGSRRRLKTGNDVETDNHAGA